MSSRVAPLDSNFLCLDTDTTHQQIASFCPLDSVPDFALLEKKFEKTILPRFPRLRQRLAEGTSTHWVEDKNFRLSDHLQHLEIPNVRDLSELAAQASKVFSSQMSLQAPLWRFFVLSSKNGSNGSSNNSPIAAVMLSVHHAMADGLGGLEILHSACETSREMSSQQSSEDKPPTEEVGSTAPSVAEGGRLSSQKNVFRLLLELFASRGRSLLNGPNSPSRQIEFYELPLDELRKLRQQLGGTMNDIFLTLVTGAVRRYQSEKGGPLDDLRAIMPVSVRKRQSRYSLGNHLTGVGVSLPVSLPDPLEQFRQIRARVGQMKKDGSFAAYASLGELAARLPRWFQRKVCNSQAKRANIICTNVPGPKKPMYLAGSRIEGNFGLAALMREQGAAFAMVTYAEKACFSLVSDPKIVPDGAHLAGCMREALAELRKKTEK